jgi:hypothetical protein
MSRLALAGLCLIVATLVGVIGSLVDAPRIASAVWALGAGIAFAGAAAGYGAIPRAERWRGVSVAALALMGLVASLWTVEATLRFADLRPDPLRVLAVVCSGVGLALLADASRRGGLLRPTLGRLLAPASILGALTADPAVSYVVGGAPLGIALLVGARARTADATHRSRASHGDRAAENVRRRGRAKPMNYARPLGAGLAAAASAGSTP